MSNFARKITIEQERQLLEHYLVHGLKATAPLCIEFGVNPTYASCIASASGRRRPRYRAGTKYKSRKPAGKFDPKDWNDHRWAWAIERGPVLA